MLSVKLICMGKLKDSYFRDAVSEYEKRLRPFCKLVIIEIPEVRLPDNPSAAQIEIALQKEGEAILSKANGMLVPLAVEGKQISSEGLASVIKDAMQHPGTISFIIGSSFGLSGMVKRAGKNISMSNMTLPHGLARVVLTEQIYRAFQILSGTKYHK